MLINTVVELIFRYRLNYYIYIYIFREARYVSPVLQHSLFNTSLAQEIPTPDGVVSLWNERHRLDLIKWLKS